MTVDEPTAIDPTAETAAAWMRACIAGDREGLEAIVSSCDPIALLLTCSGMFMAIGGQVTGSLAAFDEQLAAWQQNQINRDAR